MVTVQLIVDKPSRVVKAYRRGTIFTTDSAEYTLYVGKDSVDGLNKAALVNRATGEAIHRLKVVDHDDFVTEDELQLLIFKNSRPSR